MLLGQATPQQTERYAAVHGSLKNAGFYRQTPRGLQISSLGIGTYLGPMNDAADARYTESVIAAVRGGVNVIDTSLNYRHQRSEQAVGQAIIRLMESRQSHRDELVICTKAGYLVPNAYPPGLLSEEDLIGGMHSMAPAFLMDQIDRSRQNLGIETIDVLYLHNPETQLGFMSQDEFYRRVRLAFEGLEKAAGANKIATYGVATWEGFRKPGQLSLVRLVEIAREVAGDNHHFAFIQLPFNLAMPEGFTLRNERLHGNETSVLAAAQQLGVTVVASASILQSRLTRELPEPLSTLIPGLQTDAQRAIQFTRSTPGISTALVGMGRPEHVAENLGVGTVHPLSAEQYLAVYQSGL